MQCVRSLTLLLLLVVKVHGDFVEPPQPHTSLCSLAESQTRLPCRYQPVGGEKVVEVTWYKELADGSKDQIITAHFSEGHTEFGRYSGRVKFESSSPTENSALLIPSTEESDEGSYICHISTFPHGTFERHITLTVWILPISSLDPVILKEGDSYRLAATCKAEGRPRPRLSWDTDLPGQAKKDIREGPISNLLEVQYPPDATITSVSGDWFVGLENAELVCDSGGNPKPQDFNWTRRGGALPDGVFVIGGKLVFGRTLRLNDSGVYECVAKNFAGAGKAEYSVTIAESSQRKGFTNDENFLLIVLGSSAASLVLVLILVVLLVNRHHRNRNRKLKRQLTEKTDEIKKLRENNNLNIPTSLNPSEGVELGSLVVQQDDSGSLRQTGLGRIKVERRMWLGFTLMNSNRSLERPVNKLSQSLPCTNCSFPGGVDLAELGRPVVQHDGSWSLRQTGMDGEKEVQRRRSESMVMRSNMSPERPIYKFSQSLPCRHRSFPVRVELDEVVRPVGQHNGSGSLRQTGMDGDEEETRRWLELVRMSSNLSLERPIHKVSQSMLGGKWSTLGGVELDELGRLVIWQDGRESLRQTEMDGEKEEHRRSVESFPKNSNKFQERPIYNLSQSLPCKDRSFPVGVELDEVVRPVVKHNGSMFLRQTGMDGEEEEDRRRLESFPNNTNKLKERPIYKCSQSKLGGKWSTLGGVELDEQGRLVVWHDGRDNLRRTGMDGEKEERRRRRNKSLDSGLPSYLVPLKVLQEEGPRELDLGEGGSPRVEDWAPTQSVEEDREEQPLIDLRGAHQSRLLQ
ncbi:unnamed protein product [Pleuronectes platessa]|uniref:Ig-like domain-containing protein n=1 Tax=Pleuronectes platessa TaxID=8262 RepID=A0A9N7UAZ5_PLEPL|nr:unnamed protein product [Pleuronectes platessa]